MLIANVLTNVNVSLNSIKLKRKGKGLAILDCHHFQFTNFLKPHKFVVSNDGFLSNHIVSNWF